MKAKANLSDSREKSKKTIIQQREIAAFKALADETSDLLERYEDAYRRYRTEEGRLHELLACGARVERGKHTAEPFGRGLILDGFVI